MSYIFASHYAVRALESIGSGRRIHLVDNSFNGDLSAYAKRNPHVNYIRPPVARFIDTENPAEFHTRMGWLPWTCAHSWNVAMGTAESEWVINVNPDVMLLPQSLDMFEKLIETPNHPDVRLMRAPLSFNLWAGDRQYLLDLGGFDTRFKPCAGEDEDMLVRIAQDGKKWQTVSIPAYHQDGGHRDRVDVGIPGKGTYCNAPVFVEKHGWLPKKAEYNAIVGAAHAGGK